VAPDPLPSEAGRFTLASRKRCLQPQQTSKLLIATIPSTAARTVHYTHRQVACRRRDQVERLFDHSGTGSAAQSDITTWPATIWPLSHSSPVSSHGPECILYLKLVSDDDGVTGIRFREQKGG
jgi:hypothetical protein